MRHRIVNAFDQFHDVADKNDAEVTKLINTLGIDIAVDLKGYTASANPEPPPGADPGQPSRLSRHHGCDFIDYVIADPIVLPFTQQPFYTERIVHLPDCYSPMTPSAPLAQRL